MDGPVTLPDLGPSPVPDNVPIDVRPDSGPQMRIGLARITFGEQGYALEAIVRQDLVARRVRLRSPVDLQADADVGDAARRADLTPSERVVPVGGERWKVDPDSKARQAGCPCRW